MVRDVGSGSGVETGKLERDDEISQPTVCTRATGLDGARRMDAGCCWPAAAGVTFAQALNSSWNRPEKPPSPRSLARLQERWSVPSLGASHCARLRSRSLDGNFSCSGTCHTVRRVHFCGAQRPAGNAGPRRCRAQIALPLDLQMPRPRASDV